MPLDWVIFVCAVLSTRFLQKFGREHKTSNPFIQAILKLSQFLHVTLADRGSSNTMFSLPVFGVHLWAWAYLILSVDGQAFTFNKPLPCFPWEAEVSYPVRSELNCASLALQDAAYAFIFQGEFFYVLNSCCRADGRHMWIMYISILGPMYSHAWSSLGYIIRLHVFILAILKPLDIFILATWIPVCIMIWLINAICGRIREFLIKTIKL